MSAVRNGVFGRFILAGLALTLVGCGQSNAATSSRVSKSAPVVLVDAHGKCPANPSTFSSLCRRTKWGNAVTDDFHIPGTSHTAFRPWGIAWSFRCGRRGSLYAVVHLPMLDGIMPLTAVVPSGRSGRGYKMETHNWQPSWDSVPPQWRSPQNLALDTTCSFHVRVVVGNESIVRRYVPALPKSA